jgi:hypothetical protein
MSVHVNDNSTGRAHGRRRLRHGVRPRGHRRCGAHLIGSTLSAGSALKEDVTATTSRGVTTYYVKIVNPSTHLKAARISFTGVMSIDKTATETVLTGNPGTEHARRPESDRLAGEQRDRRRRPAVRVPGEFGHGPADHGEVEEGLRLRRLVDSSRTSCLDLRIRLQTLECSTGCVSCGGGLYWRRVCVRHYLGAS